MRIVVLMSIVLFAMLSPQISAAQNPFTAAEIFCPQCGLANKITARFCPQCGNALPKPGRMPLSAQTSTMSASQTDSAALARRALIRELVADPEFSRILQQQIQSATSAEPVVQPRTPVAKPKPVRDFFTFIGAVTCTVVFFGLALTL